ncbi:hypothetical protein IFM89_004980 [Coptis chinensis]|uniref:Glucose/Sorbosone dehydrogenase domain-containing protein n=1 Tax=Coptis chinensis TaxID=261450 RepID=A0A835HRU8_9MAGN|nr:hypothetical protein IFM89_004980 [Coptis chinensis]
MEEYLVFMRWITLLLSSNLFIFPHLSSSDPLCFDSRTPFTPKTPLSFCPYNGSVCCDTVEEFRLQKQFKYMSVYDRPCASLLKSVLCARCDPFSAELFKTKSGPRDIPILCTSTVTVNSSQSRSSTNDFCGKVWDTCQNVPILNSPFASSLQNKARKTVNSSFSKLADDWQSKGVFCEAFGGSSDNGAECFSGEAFDYSESPRPPNGICLEKIHNGTFIHMVPHPDGTDRIFVANQQGKIWLATVPKEETGGTMPLKESTPFLDVTDKVHYDTAYGLVAIAFHPDFEHNGRFFVSFYCDAVQWKACVGRCSCNSDTNCDPSKLGSNNLVLPCHYHSVIVEYTVNGSASQPFLATSANPIEVRKIFTMGLPFSGHHCGQVLFGPDGYLYFMTGDGGSKSDPYNFAQNKKSLLGKVLRFDIDNIPSAKDINDLELWGNYSIPKDNPYSNDNELRPEIWAFGLRDPWRCAFDSEKPSYLFCADSGQEDYEEVDLVTRGGNYGWRLYEGFLPFAPQSPGGNSPASSVYTIFPVMGYNHSTGSAAIIGGYVYRSMTDPCMYGRYLYADLYGSAVWAGTESPANSGNFSSALVPFTCARNSPMQCNLVAGSSLPAWGYIFSFGEDNRKDIYILTTNGVYRVARPSRCNYACSKEIVNVAGTPGHHSDSFRSGSQINTLPKEFLTSLFCSVFILLAPTW